MKRFVNRLSSIVSHVLLYGWYTGLWGVLLIAIFYSVKNH